MEARYHVTLKSKQPYGTIDGADHSIWCYRIVADASLRLTHQVGLAFPATIAIQDPAQFGDVQDLDGTTLVKPASDPRQYVYVEIDVNEAKAKGIKLSLFLLAPTAEATQTPISLVQRDAATAPWQDLAFVVGPTGDPATPQPMRGPAGTVQPQPNPQPNPQPLCPPVNKGCPVDTFKGLLPYASELFGVYQPLLGWTGNSNTRWVATERARNALQLVNALAADTNALASHSAPATLAQPATMTDVALAQHIAARAGELAATDAAARQKASTLLVAWARANAPQLLQELSAPKRDVQTALGFVDPLAGVGAPALAIVSPVGLVHLYREYFFEFDSFLGPPVGHLWLSPGGTVEVIEVSTRKLTVEQSTEQSTEVTRKSEETNTQQDDLSDAVKEDNTNNTKLGASAQGGANFGVYHADASASFSTDNTRHTSQEETHKQSRTQSEQLSSEIRSNFKTTFKTVTETTDTTSRRYVLQNTTDKLVNYELKRKFRKVGVQLQHIGTRLCWQIYLDDPGGPLGLGEAVHTVTSQSSSNMTPPDPLQPQEKGITVQFPLMPVLSTDTGSVKGDGDDRTGRHDSAFGIAPQNQPEPDPFIPQREMLNSYGNSYHIHSIYNYSATPPGAGYTLATVRINKSDPDGVWAKATVDDAAGGLFHIQLGYVWWKGKDTLNFDLTLVWNPPAQDPAMVEYQRKLRAAQQQEFSDAVRDRVKLLSNLKPRNVDDLRDEERDVVYSAVIQQLMLGNDRHVSAEALRQIFDVDEMLYFVAPDYWLPHPLPPPPPTYTPRFPQPTDDPASLAGETVLSWYGHQNLGRNNYLITEESNPAPKGASLGWLIALDGDIRRNEFLNAAWVKAVLPVRPGHEQQALAWLRAVNVEGINGLNQPYQVQPGDPPSYQGKTIGQVLDLLAAELEASNTDMSSYLATEQVFENGFDPLAGGFRVADAYQIFDQWIEVLPTDQVVAVEYDASKH